MFLRTAAPTLLILTMLAATAAPVAAREQRGRGGDRAEQVERQTKVVKIGVTGEIDLSNMAGDIVVTRGGGSDAKIDIVKTARARSDAEAREMLALVEAEVTERPGRVEIRTRFPRESPMRERRNFNVSVSYNISAPAASRVTLKSLSGDVRVSDITGDLAIDAVSGNVRIAGAARINLAKTISGNVEIVDTRSDAALDASTVSGSVILNRVRARRMDVGTVTGDVTMTDVECDRIDAHSTSGHIEFSGQLAKGGRYGLRTHSGDVKVLLAGNTGFEIEATTFSGSVRSEFPVSGERPQPAGGRGRGRIPRGEMLRGLVGDGSAVLELRTFSGNVAVAKR